jgi:WD40 repeat protein/serine/threonine protein kinase
MKPSETVNGSVEQQLFFRALEKAAGKERAAFLDGACGHNPDLRLRLEALLQKFDSLGTYLEESAVSPPDLRQHAPAPELLEETVAVRSLTEQPGDQIGRYKLLEKLGEGGFGAVYVADQRDPLKRRVALKIIKLGMDTKQVVARFEAERQALALMDHPNIAKVLDAGTTETGRPYFVMELVRGIPVTRYCDENILQTEQRLELFVKICHAIQHAHQKGIIHRDLKPSNVLVTLHDGVPVPKVIDFGIAKATQGDLTDKTVYTQFQQFIGTPAYMSPEQAEMSGLDIDTRSDVYSLGVLLYELLVGKTPFDAEALLASGLDEMRRKIREEEPVRPSTRLSGMIGDESTTTAKRRGADVPKLIHLLRGDLDWIVMKCLEKDRTRRYETANGLATDIHRHLQNEPVVARPPSKVYRFQKMVRRNKLAFAAAASVAAALLFGIVVSSWQAIRAEKARQRAQTNEQRALVAQQNEAKQRKAAQENAARAVAAENTANTNLQNASRNLYIANMNLAQQAWERNNIGRVRELLEETETYPDRGFEWYYWQRQTHLELKTLRGHTNSVSGVALSPDGQRIVTASADRTARIWDAITGKELRILAGHNAGILCVALSPDGRRMVTGSADQTARIWDATTGKQLLFLRGHVGEVKAVAFSPDGRWIVTGSGDRTARIWDASTGTQLSILAGHSGPINSVGFSTDGKRVVTGSLDRTAKVWEVATGTDALTLTNHSEEVRCVALSPDGQRVITGGIDGVARIWDLANGNEVRSLESHLPFGTECATFSPDGSRIVTGGWGNTAKIWETASGRELFTLKGHSASVRSVAFSSDGHRILTGSDDQTAKVWDADRDREALTLRGHTDWVWCVAFSPDSQRVITGSFDHMARVWDAGSGTELFTLPGDIGRILGVAFSPDGQRIAAHSDPGGKLYDARSGNELFPFKPSGGVSGLTFSSDGKQVVTLSFGDQTVRAWESATGKELGVLFRGNRPETRPVRISPDGQKVLTLNPESRAEVWEVTSGRKLLSFSTSRDINVFYFSADRQRIITAGRDVALVRNAVTGDVLLALRGHDGDVNSVTCSPDGKRIASAGGDLTVKVWEAATGKELLSLKGHREGVLSVAFSANGQRIAAGGGDNTARIWEAATTEQVADWQKEEQAARKLAELEREQSDAIKPSGAVRGQDPGQIRQWLVLAPIRLEDRTHAGMVAALARPQLLDESRLHPRAGERMLVDGVELVWRQLQLEGHNMDLNQFLGAVTEWSLAYAVCYIQSGRDQTELLMKVSRDDYGKIYLNGQELYRRDEEVPSVEPNVDVVAGVALRAGNNTLVFKVGNEESDWFGSVRFTDAAGQPLKGIRVTLTPPPLAEPTH